MIEVKETTDCHLLADLTDEIQTLHQRLDPDVFKPFDRAGILKHFETVFASGGVYAFAAEEDGSIAGYVFVSILDRKENAYCYARKSLMIDQIHVLQAYRKKGIGKLLLERVYKLAGELDIKRVELNHWTGNDTARAFFKSNGFTYFNERMYKRV